jgi:DNA-binding response OmpR family regulator
MNTACHPRSSIRQASPFPRPPRVRVIVSEVDTLNSTALAESFDACGAEADIRMEDDAAASESDHFRPDAFVMDIDRAPGDLAELCRSASDAKVMVAVAGRDDWNERIRAHAAGFDIFVTRPIQPAELLRKIGEFLTRIPA